METKALIKQTWDAISRELEIILEAIDDWNFTKRKARLEIESPYTYSENIDWNNEDVSSAVFEDIDLAIEMQYIQYGLSEELQEEKGHDISSSQDELNQLYKGILRCQDSVNKNEYDLLEEGLDIVSEVSERLKLNIEETIDSLYHLMSSLTISDSELIYIPVKPDIIVPELIVPIRQDLVERIQKQPSIIYSISPRDFEELIAELFERRGFTVQLTKKTRDGGFDIIAFHELMGIRSKYIVECKRYQRYRKINLELVQRLLGVKCSVKANKAIMVTTSSYTKDAISFANNHIWDLDLKDRDDILRWVSGE